jgi:hypothetical protein
MPRLTPFRLAAVCALAIALSLTFAVGALAKGFSANLRVVGTGGKVLSEGPVTTGAISVKTSPKATCFGAGSGGSGKSVALGANTAMGLLARGSKSIGALRPLSISDHFDFGLALCGIGKSVAKGSSSWYLKVNHKALSVGGDKAKIKPGDEVLWDLAPSFPYPNELALEAPLSASANVPFTVHVVSYDEKGKRKPVAGATVTGAAGPTAADGSTTVTLSASGELSATHGKEIPSAVVGVCVGSATTTCPVS